MNFTHSEAAAAIVAEIAWLGRWRNNLTRGLAQKQEEHSYWHGMRK
jgi:hypothetical protein